jgi:hypothetical protein
MSLCDGIPYTQHDSVGLIALTAWMGLDKYHQEEGGRGTPLFCIIQDGIWGLPDPQLVNCQS